MCGNPTVNVLMYLCIYTILPTTHQRHFSTKCTCFSENNISNRCILYKAIHRRFVMTIIYYLCIHVLIIIGKHCVDFVLAVIHYLLLFTSIHVERGRWKSIPGLDRKSTLCNEIEAEYHVMLI